MSWNCLGVKEEIKNIKTFLESSKRADKNFAAYKSLKRLDITITNLMEDCDNDTNSLLTYRRQVRLLLKSLSSQCF